ncbi:hypothetical protein [Streptomyces sp. NPDC102360]|uniref:hypothetical protein n=1 Tax=Streptomyces sp. NPDC102360 TaxID=3366160 RepID=UPI00382D294C
MVRVWALPTLLLLAGVNSPLIFPRSCSASEARRRSAQDGLPVIYWRPGCTFCMRLRLRLGRTAERFHWVNIWQDPDAAVVPACLRGQ